MLHKIAIVGLLIALAVVVSHGCQSTVPQLEQKQDRIERLLKEIEQRPDTAKNREDAETVGSLLTAVTTELEAAKALDNAQIGAVDQTIATVTTMFPALAPWALLASQLATMGFSAFGKRRRELAAA